MRRLDLLLDHVKRSSASFKNSTNNSINDLEYVQFFNDAQDHIQAEIVKEHGRTFTKEGFIDVVAGTETYNLPYDCYMGTKLVRVEFKYSSGSGDYCRLPPMTYFHRDTTSSSNDPFFYIREQSTLKLNPIPGQSVTNGVRLIYVKELRDLDIRRGVITSAAKTSSTLNTITLDLTPTLSKDDNTVTAASSYLGDLDYICIVDAYGTAVLGSIPIDSYDSTTGIITVTSGFTTSVSAAALANMYVVAGYSSTTHSELPNICERYLIAYVTLKILKRLGNVTESEYQKQELSAMETNIVEMFREPDDDIYFLEDEWGWNNE